MNKYLTVGKLLKEIERRDVYIKYNLAFGVIDYVCVIKRELSLLKNTLEQLDPQIITTAVIDKEDDIILGFAVDYGI